MKVVSWKTLIITLIVGGGLVYYVVRDGLPKELATLIWLCFLIYLIGKGLVVSFSAEAYEDDKKRASIGKRLYREKFGIFAPIMPYLALIAIVLDALLVKLCPPTMLIKVLSILILVASVIYEFCLSRWFTKSMKAALEQESNDTLQA